jgi:hypothetical protein
VERKVKTDDPGRAAFDDLPAHEFQASARASQDGLQPTPAKFVPSGQEVVLRVPASATVSGVVAWSDGAPEWGAAVMVLSDDALVFFTSADREGRFAVQIPTADPRSFRLETFGIGADKRRVTMSRPVSASDRDVRLELRR